jgi:hypothetical protein
MRPTVLLRIAWAAASVLVIALFSWASFQPEARFYAPADRRGTRLSCLYRLIYQWEGDAQVLVFGTSRTWVAIDPTLLAERLTLDSDVPITVAKFSMPDVNPGLSYQIFQEYLSRHEPPELIILEAQQVKKTPSVVRVSRYFSMTAKLNLYLDLVLNLEAGSFVGRSADALRLLIDHYDKSISKALSPRQTLSLKPEGTPCGDKWIGKHLSPRQSLSLEPEGNPCAHKTLCKAAGKEKSRDQTAKAEKLERSESLPKESQKNLKKYRRQAPKAAKKQQEKALMAALQQQALQEAWDQRGDSWEQLPAWDWRYTLPAAERYLLYYRRFAAWAEENGARIVFFRPPGYLEPPSTPEQLSQFEALAGAPVLAPDRELLRRLYPLYADTTHMGRDARPLVADWIARSLRSLSAPGSRE